MVAEARAAGTVSNCLENAQGTVSWKALLKTRMELMTTSATLCCRLQLPQIPILIVKMKSVNSENTYKKSVKMCSVMTKQANLETPAWQPSSRTNTGPVLGLPFLGEPGYNLIQLGSQNIMSQSQSTRSELQSKCITESTIV